MYTKQELFEELESLQVYFENESCLIPFDSYPIVTITGYPFVWVKSFDGSNSYEFPKSQFEAYKKWLYLQSFVKLSD